MSDETNTGIAINATLAECVNYASWQNSVPLLKSLEVCNQTNEVLQDVRIELETYPALTRAKSWVIDQLQPGDVLTLRDRNVQLDPGYLEGLNEAERATVTFKLFQQNEVLLETNQDIRVLARDEWGGMGESGELLAAFVMPNDPAIPKLLKTAGELLFQYGHDSALDGYQSGDPRRAYMLSAALWSAIAGKSLTYANPPKSFESKGQKTRRPTTILEDSLATCLDSTLLFAAAIEAIGLNPVIVLVHGHCFAGVWLVEKTFNRLIEEDCSEVRKAIASREFLVFETTLVTHQPPGTFEHACETAQAALSIDKEDEYVGTIDISRARMTQIRPLASHNSHVIQQYEKRFEIGPMPLPAMPNLGQMPADIAVEKPTTPNGRIDRWQRKLLDLTLRNRLLNFKQNKQCIPLLCPDISLLEDRLAAGKKLRIISLPEQNPLGERDEELHLQRTNQDLNTEFSIQALNRGELASPLTSEELSKRLTTIYRNVRNDLSEGGSNTLFLAVGFLRWKPKADDPKSYLAPLLLVPVKLQRKSAASAYRLELHEDELRFNSTLIQLLKKDFACDLSHFESDLPTDAHGVDVPLILDRMRAAVRDISGFEVVDETALGTFSFAKYLMWKDLVDRVDQLENNRVVRHLIHDPDKPFVSDQGRIPRPEQIDIDYAPAEIYHPLPADSSQLAAVMAVAEGQDFVLIGPPGTGKSQTIANMISQCLAMGKTVLFVAEKTAALDVVFRRLREQGLGDCCLELHSNKAERRRFLDQLQSSWTKNRQPQMSEWLEVSERLRIRRDELNAYVNAIHEVHSNGWTAYKALGISIQGRDRVAIELNWPESVQQNEVTYNSLVQHIDKMALTYGAIDPAASLPMIQMTEWSATWEKSLFAVCSKVDSASKSLRIELQEFTKSIGLPNKVDCSMAELDQLKILAGALLACEGQNGQIIFDKQFKLFPKAVDELEAIIEAHSQAQQSAAANYSESLELIPLDTLDQQWREATAAMWPMSWFATRKVTRLLQSYATSGSANPETDISAIREIKRQLDQLHGNPLSAISSYWQGLATDTNALRTHLKDTKTLRSAITTLGKTTESTNQISKAIYSELATLSDETTLIKRSRSFVHAVEHYLAQLNAYQEIAGNAPTRESSPSILSETLSALKHVSKNRTQLQRWTEWCGVRQKADTLGLKPILRELDRGTIASSELADAFKLAYARWWLPSVIDQHDVLRTFQKFKHEDAIQDFCKLDDLARETAASQVRQAIVHDLPAQDAVARKSELGLLRHQMNLKRPSKSIREVISSMPESFGKLAPCLLMSPLSIAQYLPTQQAIFDVVLFDEASQITTWDAIGAIARAKQTVIVGDPKQLPPTNFFGRVDDDEQNEELDDYERDLESILDEASASGLPILQLNWHYRSRHESLIAFSNWHYYNNKLVTFPAAESIECGVSLVHLPNALYDRGKSRTNLEEAKAIVANAVKRMQRQLEQPEDSRLTYGVITFNSQQQTLIQDLFDDAQRAHPELEWYFADDRIEPTVVKNLENVQGDERDVMFFSITFGKDASGKEIPLTFGALNRDGGERRLNVAVTRARRELVVYSSFKADQLQAERSKMRGVRDLKAFLDYADKGPIAFASQPEGSVGDFDSPFEEAVAQALTDRGWDVVPQVGVSGFRVDLGIVHPDKPGAFIAGVECDGATYHRSAVARDRDKTRQQVLENLGWKILRVWSPDWWYDAANAIETVHSELDRLLREARSTDSQQLSEVDA